MKKIKIMAVLVLLVGILFGGMMPVQAATTLPETVVSDKLREVEYLENFPVIIKSAENGKYYIYCMNMSATYGANIKFNKTDKVDPGFVYIILNRPQTEDKDRDFYITQMAVWYYEDYLNQDNFNLVADVKKYILSHQDNEVCKNIIDLLQGAKAYAEEYKNRTYKLEFDKSKITFKQENGYFVSSDIKLYTENINSEIKYTLTDAPTGTVVVNNGNKVNVKIPVESVPYDKEVNFKLSADGAYTEYTGYYYFHNSKYQKVLFQDPLETNITLSDEVLMGVIRNIDDFEVEISKTDITQANEVEGATLVIKDEKGNVMDTWISTKETHKVVLKAGKYSFSETLAPKGYKLSTTTIYFLIDENGKLFVKNDKDEYVTVDKVVLINELLDIVSFAKRDSKTNSLLKGATLAIKDSKGKLVKEFVTGSEVYKLELEPGEYTLSEVKAPEGYLKSNEVVYFSLLSDGTLKVKDSKNKYVDSAVITFYNTPDEVPVPATDANATILYISGIALLIGGLVCVKKISKEC